MNRKLEQPSKSGRVFLRVSAGIPAEALEAGRIRCVGVVSDLSAGGLALVTDQLEAVKTLPRFFDMRFRLPRSRRPISFEVEQKGCKDDGGKAVLSCEIKKISPQDRKLLDRYLRAATDLGLPYSLIDAAAFLCCLDSLWRISARFVYRYYTLTPFGNSELSAMPLSLYDLALFVYAAASFASFAVLNGLIPKRYASRRFTISIALLSVPVIFLALRLSGYIFGGNLPDGWASHLFIGLQSGLLLYTLLSIAIGILSLPKVTAVLSALEEHRIQCETVDKC